MKLIITFLILCSFSANLFAQRYYDSIQHVLKISGEDTNRVHALFLMATWYESTNADSNDYFAHETINLAEKLHYTKGKFFGTSTLFFAANRIANYTRALEIALNGVKIAESMKDPQERAHYLAFALGGVGIVKNAMHDTIGRAERIQLIAALTNEFGKMDGDFWTVYMGIANQFHTRGREDSARYYWAAALEWAKRASTNTRYCCLCAAFYGVYLVDSCQDYPTARNYFQAGIGLADYYNNLYIKTRIYKDLVHYFIRAGNTDSALYFGRLALEMSAKYHFGDYASMASDSLAGIFERKHMPDSALHYIRINQATRDSIFSGTQLTKFRAIFEENERKQKEQEASRERFINNVKLYVAMAAFAVALLISGILYRNNRQKQKANALLVRQREEISWQRMKAEDALEELKTTQAQLIQREKMASLGEMTAGVAHEIQNPLNFVNNFSELNTELFDEMEHEFKVGNSSEGFAIAENIKQNMAKINQHGKRADAIVKGMLQHSRTGSGQKELTDLNAMAEEYLNLSYHGIRAREKNFDCQINFSPDSSLPRINLVPQDIGRVLLNICNNAFYSVNEKRRLFSADGKNLREDYSPVVMVQTKKIKSPSGNGPDLFVEIRIRDNGLGISPGYKDKIFQPFFTTKPAGQGTGLGLSLSYDIITKEHHGTIELESREGEYAEFVIRLPMRDIG